MADIQLRFHKDMLVLSAPIDYALARQGVDVQSDFEFVSLMEPEMATDALRLEALAGAQCLVAATEGICPARLAHERMEDRAADIAESALGSVRANTPQHALCEIGPSRLPLDPSSKVSVKQNAAQYEAAAAAFDGMEFDALLLNGMRSAADMRCAVEGVRRAYDGPLFASLDVDEEGRFAGMTCQEAVEAMAGADVVGVRGPAAPEALCATVREIAQLTEAPILVQIVVKAPTAAEKKRASLGGPIPGNPYPVPDALADAALALRAAGAQFLRACGEATPAYTGALAVVALGRDCVR